eukprot:CAMPEP_0197603958 /NCGR_PEP_ID=MMETSP1326-20131121/40247_1 /TAXON_ID=1155430 /ORGANISM="Genus nov. species nov., Strain RCC2288" /LENGTH=40 /DNA_ID= /DNA_START= /DNA_END= /DNA_ORIENTATION=
MSPSSDPPLPNTTAASLSGVPLLSGAVAAFAHGRASAFLA